MRHGTGHGDDPWSGEMQAPESERLSQDRCYILTTSHSSEHLREGFRFCEDLMA